MYDYKLAKTQKAKSVLLACPLLQQELVVNTVRPDYSYSFDKERLKINNQPILFKDIDDVNMFIVFNPNFWAFKQNVFARPCPLTPRHGFVESQLIHSHNELKKLFELIINTDSKGEMILTQFIDNSTYSAVLTTSGMLSIGPGFDGATGGKKSISFPVAPAKLSKKVMIAAGLPENSSAFIESVFSTRNNEEVDHNMSFHITQVRGGPEVPCVSDFIPKKMKIEYVIRPSYDLVFWESAVKNLQPNTVVYAPGHSLTSHAAIHCIINNIPFVTSFYPNIGDTIKPVSNTNINLNLESFMKGIYVGLIPNYSMDIMLHLSATILHNWAYLRNSEHASWLLGISASYMSQVLLALCIGEYRHSKVKNKFYGNSRDIIYSNIIKNKKFLNYIHRAPLISAAFKSKVKFPSTEFGGVKWANAMNMAINIWNSVIKIQNKGLTVANGNRLVNNINKATNLVHNGGWLFNKITLQARVDKISFSPNFAALELSDYIYELYSLLSNVDTSKKLSLVNVKDRIKK